MKSPGRGPYPNGSTELTLDNEGLRRRERERDRPGILESCQQVTQNRNGVQAVFGLGVWEEGGWRKSGPIVALAGIVLTASGGTALGVAGSDSRRVEGAHFFLAPLVCHTPMWLG